MKNIIVAQDGSGQYRTIQEAINAVSEEITPVTIYIKEGVYRERITIDENHCNLVMIGDGMDKTIITYDNYAGKLDKEGNKLGTTNSASVFIDGDDFYAQGITFENSFHKEGFDCAGRQAVAVNITGKHCVFKNCGFHGYQDTLYVREGSSYFDECFIKGDIDFIFGAAQAVFYRCQIHSIYTGSDTNNGYVAAASTRASDEYGFLFEECRLTADDNMPENTVYLGRPWHPSSCIDPVRVSMVYKNCNLGAHIKEEGWSFMGKVQPETERLYEYENRGFGAVVNRHRNQLTKENADLYTKENILR